VGQSRDPVRIVVAEPASRRGGVSLGTVEALRRIGRGVRIEVVHDGAAAVELARQGADLVVLDRALGAEAARVLDALRRRGPPVVIVTEEATADVALATFEAGAADCVTASDDFAEVLPAVALEQIRVWRARTARREVQQRIRSLERLHAAIIDQFPAAIAVLDAGERIVAMNPAFERAFAAAGCEGRALAAVLPADLIESGELLDLLARARSGAERAPRVAHSAAAKEPQVFDARAERLDSEGRLLLVLSDVTERERLAQNVRELQSQMLHHEKMASLGRLAAGVAHEINNPMGFVHANLAQMREYLDDVAKLLAAAREGGDRFGAAAAALDVDTLLDDFGQAIRESQEGSERIRHIVQDLRAFAHRDDGEWVEADLNRCLDSTAHIVWTMMKHSVVLRKEYGALPPVRCHPKQLEQVFMNLLVNAYQAIEARLARDGRGGEIVLRTESANDCVRVTVADDGAGIAPEHRDRIFEPFFTTKEVGEGTGLGLSTSFEIVRRHGGTLAAAARPGGGSVFEVLLPKDGGTRT
jgi:signal transduction histidine kinase